MNQKLKLTYLMFSFFISHLAIADLQDLKTSVIIPCYHQHAIHLHELLQCYEEQTILPDEIVISISEANRIPKDIIDNLKNTQWTFPIIYILSNKITYAGENRNKASQAATGDIFVYQDADDLPGKNRIQAIKYFFETYPVDLVIHKFSLKDNLQVISPEDIEFVFIDHYKELSMRSDWSFFHNGNIAIRRTIFDTIQWTNKKRGQDVEFNCKACKQFNAVLLLEPLVLYRTQYSSLK